MKIRRQATWPLPRFGNSRNVEMTTQRLWNGSIVSRLLVPPPSQQVYFHVFAIAKTWQTTPLRSSVPRRLFLNQKSHLPLLRLRRRHELPDGLEDRLDLLIVSAHSTFQFFQLPC